MAHWTEEVTTWTLRHENGTSKVKVKQSIRHLLRRQKGKLVTIQKVAKHVKKELRIVARHCDLHEVMLEMKAKTVEGTARNRYIYDITDCVLKEMS